MFPQTFVSWALNLILSAKICQLRYHSTSRKYGFISVDPSSHSHETKKKKKNPTKCVVIWDYFLISLHISILHTSTKFTFFFRYMVAFWLKRFIKNLCYCTSRCSLIKMTVKLLLFHSQITDLRSDPDFKGILGQSLPATYTSPYICIPISVHALGLYDGLKAFIFFV